MDGPVPASAINVTKGGVAGLVIVYQRVFAQPLKCSDILTPPMFQTTRIEWAHLRTELSYRPPSLAMMYCI